MEGDSGIEAAMNRHWTALRLPPEFEAGFEAWAAETRRPDNQLSLFLVLATCLLFLAVDAHAGQLGLGLVLRFGLQMPAILWGIARLNRTLGSGALAFAVAVPFAVVMGTSVALGMRASPAIELLYVIAIGVAAYATNILARLRLRHTAVMCLCNLAILSTTLSNLFRPPGDIYLIVIILGGLASGSLISVARRERGEQDFYLLKLRGERQALELQHLVTELSRLSSLDALTGAGNRRSFDLRLAAEWRSAIARGGRIALVLMDVDHFKMFNDAAGHVAGDNCLRAVARAIAAGAGWSIADVSRYGGEEFALILSPLPGAGSGEAAALAERVRRAVEGLALPHPGLAPGRCVSVSLGVAEARPGVGSPNPGCLIEAADAALYRAKKTGRNRVVSGDPLGLAA